MKRGIFVLGNAIVDLIKEIASYPEQGHLAKICKVEQHTGGNVCNLLIDLAVLDPKLPLTAAACIGRDTQADFITERLQEYKIDTKHLFRMRSAHTSFTDVISEKKSKQRTFFFYPGAGGLLNLEQICSIKTQAKIVQLGYLGALPELEVMSGQRASDFSLALAHFKQQGCLTAIDLVSGPVSEELRKVFFSCLPQTDFLFINELEAQAMLKQKGNVVLKSAALSLLNAGVASAVVLHSSKLAVYADVMGQELEAPSLHAREIQGAVGAGDAFAAGFLYGMHEAYEAKEALQLAHAAAYFNLTSTSSTGGARPLVDLLNLIKGEQI